MSGALRQGLHIAPPVQGQGEVIQKTLAATNHAEVDLSAAANRPAAAPMDSDFWFDRYVSIYASGDTQYAISASNASPLTAGTDGLSVNNGAVIPGGATVRFRMPGKSSGNVWLLLYSTPGATVRIWRSSPL